jgi:hypothetical protein
MVRRLRERRKAWGGDGCLLRGERGGFHRKARRGLARGRRDGRHRNARRGLSRLGGRRNLIGMNGRGDFVRLGGFARGLARRGDLIGMNPLFFWRIDDGRPQDGGLWRALIGFRLILIGDENRFLQAAMGHFVRRDERMIELSCRRGDGARERRSGLFPIDIAARIIDFLFRGDWGERRLLRGGGHRILLTG